jgi:hypothetical protein
MVMPRVGVIVGKIGNCEAAPVETGCAARAEIKSKHEAMKEMKCFGERLRA